ncbi:hypothetical protein [Devosia sp.]|uniref:hypothetical protein n=1 Tax=Devosia sp. TaxID=1871048 RepID=UPI002FCA9CF4
MSCNEARYLTDAAIALGDELATGTCQPVAPALTCDPKYRRQLRHRTDLALSDPDAADRQAAQADMP